ncbi:MAG TPA: hypothetical protein VFU71_04105, partial [Burkholderiaceae bacterium]|nr:hypothetical protein [Burkholderiaceae bacterium]
RYLDRSDRHFKDRRLFLVTSRLDPATRAAVEFFMETKTNGTERDVFKFRHLFSEFNDESFEDLLRSEGKSGTVCLTHYFEDENG